MQNQADEILREQHAIEILGKYGDVHLHGSYKLDLMTWPEIDIWILSDDFQSSMAWDIIKDLANAVPPTHVHVINQFDHQLGRTPPDCISIDYRFLHEQVEWKLDICASSYARCGRERGQNYFLKITLTLFLSGS